jgi:hypothetical protein
MWGGIPVAVGKWPSYPGKEILGAVMVARGSGRH